MRLTAGTQKLRWTRERIQFCTVLHEGEVVHKDIHSLHFETAGSNRTVLCLMSKGESLNLSG